ncbi:MAG: 30S ribosomal protein S12 methylthiotransferase RimO [Erysipelotrichaceae bacterium]|nr:30S ribosomal protein S12 methylthiotransferase RimO [Erysipelotrichaceae bacterium]
MKIGMISLGCAKNLVDTENVLGLLKQADQEIVTSYDDADAIIINTCGFIESAKSEAIETILDVADLKKRNLKKLIVMGCLAKRYKPQLEKEMPEVDRFISIDEYARIGSILSEELGVHISNNYGLAPRVLSGKLWMAYLSISDGCNNRCAFCAIPFIRGNLHSQPMPDVLKEAKRLADSGVQEITLVAQDCTRYGYDWDNRSHLSELLKELDQIDGIRWIRMLYMYPDEMPDDLIETIRTSRHVLPYFDIPTQHGSDAVLKRMRRKTSRAQILSRVHKIREEIPDAVLRTTLITGFPGETLEEHEENVSLVKEIGWDHLGVFTYSREEGTAAYDMDDNVSPEEKERRKSEIMSIQEGIAEERLSREIGHTETVLIERYDPLTHMFVGRTWKMAPDNVDGNIRFHPCKDHEVGTFTSVIITKTAGQNLIGDEIQEESQS